MSHTTTQPRPRDISVAIRSIRERWDRQKRRERRAAAQTKQRQLAILLGTAGGTFQHAV